MKKLVKLLSIVLLLSLLTTFAASCNTIEGAGEDIEQAGEGIQEAAD